MAGIRTSRAVHRTVSVQEQVRPNGPSDRVSDDLTHVHCCEPYRALCGADLHEAVIVEPEEETTCVVCADLDEQPCPKCGL